LGIKRASSVACIKDFHATCIAWTQVYKQQEGVMHKEARNYGKTLTADTVHEAFTIFANNGRHMDRPAM
jgi:hypothetical protein